MSKQRNRINLTLDDDLYSVITELSQLSDTPRASIIHELLNDVKPQLQVSIDLIKKLKANEMQMSNARQVFLDMLMDTGDVIHQAQGEFNKALREINKETDEELDNATNSGKSD
ncbi:hypothetical protein [Pseudoalteromonas sp.]|uniref:hypothetical protein n=1 Tax=Pseudoalteromonas sp. TaxID=53249 RepID=UPI00257D875F|nr:hypothetical protein [Pseudoalteromonas sp.]